MSDNSSAKTSLDFEMIEKLKDKKLCKVRTVTTFINLYSDMATWQAALKDAITHCEKVVANLNSKGYTVQSIRIVTNPYGEYLDTSSLSTASTGLATITSILDVLNEGKSGLRVRFAIGEAKTAQEIELLPELIAQYGDLCNACVNVTANEIGVLDNALIEKCAETIQAIAKLTPRGEGNFNFTVNFNCDEFIPYFPASYHSGKTEKGFVVGLETPDLLVETLQYIRKESLLDGMTYQKDQQFIFEALSKALQYHINNIDSCVQQLNSASDWRYLGIDTSPAPSKDCHSMVDVYKLLGVPYFGASGTVETSALLTRVFKSITDVDMVGFSGLMLAVTEDKGLAQATLDNEFDIPMLLTNSAICGIGLDTVPIPGDTPKDKLCALMRDTGTMAYRLNKPLTVRVFPVPELDAGDITQFESSDLCNCAVLAVP